MAKTPAKKSKAKSGAASDIRKLPINELYPVDELLPTTNARIEARKIEEIASLLWLPKSLSEDETNTRVNRAIDLYESLKPADGAETMLAVQMVGTHSAALECLRRAALEGLTFVGRDQNLKHATKLMGLYAKQLETLNKHRGKGQQKVTVEYVNVEAGGQAVVGNVETQSRAGGTAGRSTALDAPGDLPIDVTPLREPSNSKVKK